MEPRLMALIAGGVVVAITAGAWRLGRVDRTFLAGGVVVGVALQLRGFTAGFDWQPLSFTTLMSVVQIGGIIAMIVSMRKKRLRA